MKDWMLPLNDFINSPEFEFRTRPAYFIQTAMKLLNKVPNTIVEVGVFRGETSVLLRKFFPQTKLFLVDPWRVDLFDDGQTIATKFPTQREWNDIHASVCVTFLKDPSTKILRMSSSEAAFIMPSFLDLVFVDAIHSYEAVMDDIKWWLPKVRTGGVLCGHDYIKKWPGVKKAVNESLSDQFVVGSHGTWFHVKE